MLDEYMDYIQAFNDAIKDLISKLKNMDLSSLVSRLK